MNNPRGNWFRGELSLWYISCWPLCCMNWVFMLRLIGYWQNVMSPFLWIWFGALITCTACEGMRWKWNQQLCYTLCCSQKLYLIFILSLKRIFKKSEYLMKSNNKQAHRLFLLTVRWWSEAERWWRCQWTSAHSPLRWSLAGGAWPQNNWRKQSPTGYLGGQTPIDIRDFEYYCAYSKIYI